jgi:membrane associated rhomboid family serine protease
MAIGPRPGTRDRAPDVDAKEVAMSRKIVLAVLLFLAGGAIGCGAGIVSGVVWIDWAETSCFEGYCGYVVALHALFGIVFGAVAGLWLSRRLGRRLAS